MATAKKNNIIKAEAVAEIDVPLTPEQLEAHADQAANLMKDLLRKEEEYKLVKREWSADLKEIRMSIQRYLDEYQKRAMPQEVECFAFFDLDKKLTWYEYKGKKIQERELDDYELSKAKQEGLFGDGPDLPEIMGNNKKLAAVPDEDDAALPGCESTVTEGPF